MMSATNLPNTELTTLDSKWNLGCLVKVKAQVMTRDDSTGMWVPMSGGGMSIVSLHRILAPRVDDDGDDVAYVIHGQRIADKSMALHCELLSDLEYTCVNPTFHHWTTNSKRFGLTFQTSSDATAFQKSIHRLEQNMKHGPVDSKAQLHVMAEEVLNVLQQAQISTQVAVADSDKISAPPSLVHRPCTKDSSRAATIPEEPASQASPRPQCITPRVHIKHHHPTVPLSASTRDPPATVPPQAPPRLPLEITSDSSTGITLGDYGYYVDVSPNSGIDKASDIWLEGSAKDLSRKVGLLTLPPDEADDLIYFSGSYVHFARNTDPEKHDYCYPSLDTFGTSPYGTTAPPAGGPPRPAGDPRRAHLSTSVPVPLPIKTRRKWLKRKKKSLPATSKSSATNTSSSTRHRGQGPKLRCVYCHECFSWDENRPGSCRDGPDRVLACIKAATCVCCRDAVAYHCKGDEDDTDDSDQLDCGGSGRGSGRRRAALVLICLVVPCLWCYLPFRACHRLGVACGCCGPRHKAA